MSFTGNFMATSFKTELLKGCHDFTLTTGDAFKLALYTSSATFDATTTAYTATNEVAASGSYSAGGGTLTNITATNSGTTAFTDFADIDFTTATITARGAMIYNTTPNTTSSAGLVNPTVVILDFGSDKTSTSGTFTVVFPSATSSTAIIRIA
ncbi:hypothetical protein UFOVP1064_51 [uncultured Caudovirales phage]|uniref:Uncharacterized protein n=1 Tax=uncultured Caudovirales phage TaxID=2100421 RepID=A0A6J5S9A1_9CAUD|nr:hypothetical protein UFOVP659_24 [uncultured Caudovirales phage]CAB4169300.1 hypothetical protein UFOVP885_3 [uncultured Caudovirales phage]CAB4181646.1 hypothetical protein UFOVP1064_51 [uncultured Caudovirales phage]CAB4189731.1 hypothetical protein UFOVP1197_12 [uncultured Caudovirales phage]CAB4195254.1 hypothetical protein UFOVP1294_4 [uncultured Caudovirales phage]